MTRDPGLQPERTALAWSRTALLFAVNAGLLLRVGVPERDPGPLALGALLAAFSAWLAWRSGRRRAELALDARSPTPRRVVAGVAALAATAAAGGLWMVLR